MKIEEVHDVEIVRPILAYRESHSTAPAFGIETSMAMGLADLAAAAKLFPQAIFVCYDGPDAVGCIVVNAAPNFYGPQTIAVVKYWYAMPNTVTAGPTLMKAAFRWAKRQGCSHLLSNATELFAAPNSDKVARFYEQIGMKLLERVYIGEV